MLLEEYVFEDKMADFIDEIKLSFASVILRVDGIVEVQIREDIRVSIEQVKDISKAIAAIGNGRSFPVLIKPGLYSVPDEECRKFVASNKSKSFATAEAYVLNCLPQKLIANFYINFHKPQRPTKMFESESEAVKWLKSFV